MDTKDITRKMYVVEEIKDRMTKQEAIELIELAKAEIEWNYPMNYQVAFDIAIKALEQEPCRDMGEVSDGYHTFNQLYYQRAVLFATIVNSNKDKAWKSFKHFDGKYCFDRNGEWFIVGVDTPKGSYTYHYSKEYWDMFDCKELERGKEWDGHTEEDVTRLLSLEQELLTDKEQRIFLAAMSREEKVCKEVDAKYPYKEPYEDSLVSVCHSIERKVKKILWA